MNESQLYSTSAGTRLAGLESCDCSCSSNCAEFATTTTTTPWGILAAALLIGIYLGLTLGTVVSSSSSSTSKHYSIVTDFIPMVCRNLRNLLVRDNQRKQEQEQEQQMDKIHEHDGGDYVKDDRDTLVASEDGLKKEVKSHSSSIPLSSTPSSHDNGNIDDERQQILEGAIQLFSNRFASSSPSNDPSNNVVNYISPDEMLSKLFPSSSKQSMSLSSSSLLLSQQTNINVNTTSSSNNSSSSRSSTIVNNFNQNNNSTIMVQLFEQIQKYSVNTDHPLFFNQLFGALDPIALAAELVALSVNTSVYTWETAPVFTLIEREVMMRLGRLVFGGDNSNSVSPAADNDDNDHDDDEGDALGINSNEYRSKYDGLMLPGGSLSNLTAIHVARHYSRQSYRKTIPNNNHEEGEEKKEHDHDYENDVNVHDSVDEDEEYDVVDARTLEEETKKTTPPPQLVAFVSSEAHYSFTKSVSVTGIGIENLILVPTLPNGQMDVQQLDILMTKVENERRTDGSRIRIPFFVAVTAGSTVRGSFDDIEAIVKVCRKHEDRLNQQHTNDVSKKSKIWIHVDGAWGGSAIFSSRPDMKTLLKGVQDVDSFTFNPHKMLGAPQQTSAFITRHKGVLKAANSSGAKYLFDCRKNGAEWDLGDASYTCGRRTDAIKLWALWKYYGPAQIGSMLEQKVDSLSSFAAMIQKHDSFMLACSPWPFNVNFFYIPERIRLKMRESGVDMKSENPVVPDEISKELAMVSVKLKLLLHQSGEMLIPYQPLSNQKADCFRLVLAGNKTFHNADFYNVLRLMEKYGSDL